MDQVITFDKSLQQRLQEYTDVLSGYEVLPVSAITREWGFYLELVLDPNGWQAIWKIPRKKCEELNIPFPTVVLVLVLSIDLKDLMVFVRVLAVQDDIIQIPEKHHVPLMQLWPTREQDRSIALNLHSTANALDMLRFFYHNLFMPWDCDDDDSVDWKSRHLEQRLRLYYDVKNGIVPRGTAEHLQALISEAKRLQVKREHLEKELEELEDFDENCCVSLNDVNVQALMEMHIRMLEIKGEVEVLENPLLRAAVIKKHKQVPPNGSEMKQKIWIVYDIGTANNCMQFLSQVETFYPEKVLKFSPTLVASLEYANADDIVILNASTHVMKSTGGLEYGGILKGINQKEDTILTSDVDGIMMDFRGESVVIENLTVQAALSQCAIVVRQGKVTMHNCKLIGDGKSSIHQGIIVLNGGTLEITNCDISNFCTAIVGNSGSNIVIKHSDIYNCNFGLKIYDNCGVNAVKATIRNCRNYGICVETENNLSGQGVQVGDFDTLNIIPKVQMELMSGGNNEKGDAAINALPKLYPVEDLFENRDSDPTVCIESDDEMDTHNNTVIENGRVSPATV